ncbi:hypothetical protein K3495_g10549 [Podosphaera aphanis]|nr:hypothetical protein K3495_g10549 [Podosphaera aphanis]
MSNQDLDPTLRCRYSELLSPSNLCDRRSTKHSPCKDLILVFVPWRLRIARNHQDDEAERRLTIKGIFSEMQGSNGIHSSWRSQRSRPYFSDSSKDHRPHGQATKKDVPCIKLDVARKATNSSTERPKKKRSPSATTVVMLVANQPSSIKAASKNDIPPIPRRHSWLSNISSKFSSVTSINSQNSSKLVNNLGAAVPKIHRGAPKKATLSHVHKSGDNVSPKPLLPRNNHAGFLQNTLKRLSNSSNLNPNQTSLETDVCKRMLLNVDRNRQRCEIKELNGNRLRRVAFCVDIEVSSCPKYLEDKELRENMQEKPAQDKEDMSYKIERDVLDPEVARSNEGPKTESSSANGAQHDKITLHGERLTRKEKKRKLAQAYGSVPVEFTRKNSNASSTTNRTESEYSPSSDPVRIYRRCCQLRETPVLKNISEQLACFSNQTRTSGVIDKLDLSNHSLALPDLITLGDYLAIVPVYELVLDNCGLTDEGVRVILAGLLAANSTKRDIAQLSLHRNNQVPQAGFAEKLVLKNNTSIGKNGWMYICTFIAMCRSVKSIDLSKVPFPSILSTPPINTSTTVKSESTEIEMSIILGKSIAGRLGGKELKILNMAYCGLNTDQLGNLIDGAIKSGLCRLGLAGNKISSQGLKHVVRYIRQGQCIGLDLGDNDLGEKLEVISEAFEEDSPLSALSLACCNLTPDSLSCLFPALVKLKNFEYIDLSQNTRLFDLEPSAIPLLRRYLPKIRSLKRITLMSVSLSPDQAIALAEILPELPKLAHINIMENHLLASLADSNAKNEAEQGEACALYASLMAATRASKSIVCVDIEVPCQESSEIVKALAKQVVAYCLWNMDHESIVRVDAGCETLVEKDEAVLEALVHLVGRGGASAAENIEAVEVSMSENGYVISGTGVAKALGICLENRGNDARELMPMYEGSLISNDGAKDMSKFLLESARRIRTNLPSTAGKESSVVDLQCCQKIQFLDETLGGLIKRFEDEFPETCIFPSSICMPLSPPISTKTLDDLDDLDELENPDIQELDSDSELAYSRIPPSEEDFHPRPADSWLSSEILVASREEEGQIHRFGQKLKRDFPKPDEGDKVNQNTYPVNLELLRELVEGVGGEELKNSILTEGVDTILEELRSGVSTTCRQLQEKDPKAWAIIRERIEIVGYAQSPIEI